MRLKDGNAGGKQGVYWFASESVNVGCCMGCGLGPAACRYSRALDLIISVGTVFYLLSIKCIYEHCLSESCPHIVLQGLMTAEFQFYPESHYTATRIMYTCCNGSRAFIHARKEPHD